MTDRWDFARALWREHFGTLETGGFTLERTDEDLYWATHERELRPHFPPETIISMGRLRTANEVDGQARLAEVRDDHPLDDFCVVRHDERVAAMFCGKQEARGVYRMWHSNVHPDFRRRGLYKRILAGTLAYTAALGFDRVVSDHAPGNNAILIAKLSAGFRITGMEVDPAVGASVVLHYFHNADHLAAYEYRCGLATMNDRIAAKSFGAMKQLATQFAASLESS